MLSCNPDVIGFTVYSTSRHFSYELAMRIKEKDNKIIIVFGGPQCFRNCEGMDTLKRPYIDAVCLGEGDIALPKMLSIIAKNKGAIGRCAGFGIRDKAGNIIDCGDEKLLDDLSMIPYADYSDSIHITVGNPDLKPAVANIYSASYSIMDGNFSGHIGTGYALTTNGIQPVTSLINSNVMRTTYENLATQKSYYIWLSFNGKFFNWLEIGPNLSVDQNEFISPTVNTKGRQWSSSMRTKLSIDQFKFQFDFRYSSSSISAQQTNKANFSANAAAKTLLFDKSLSLTLRVTDIFNTKNNNYDRSGSNFSMVNSTRENTRIFTLDISYFFQSKANDIIDDVVEEVPDDF